MNVREAITRAYYLSNVVSRDLETVTGSQISDGLIIFNSLLGEKSATGRFLPYYDHLQVPSVAGQDTYDIDNLIVLDTMTFNIKNVRYLMKRDERFQHWGTPRVDNIESLPFHYYSERILNGTRIYLYFIPNQDIDFFTLTGRFSLTRVSLDDELDDRIDSFYQNYLVYLAAKRICNEYSLSFPPQKEQVLQELEYNCVDLNKIDFSMRKISTLSTNTGLNYGDINIGKGWRP